MKKADPRGSAMWCLLDQRNDSALALLVAALHAHIARPIRHDAWLWSAPCWGVARLRRSLRGGRERPRRNLRWRRLLARRETRLCRRLGRRPLRVLFDFLRLRVGHLDAQLPLHGLGFGFGFGDRLDGRGNARRGR